MSSTMILEKGFALDKRHDWKAAMNQPPPSTKNVSVDHPRDVQFASNTEIPARPMQFHVHAA